MRDCFWDCDINAQQIPFQLCIGQLVSWVSWELARYICFGFAQELFRASLIDVSCAICNVQVYLYEQLPNFTFLPQPLPVPAARDYTAADFDGDGDIDIMISVPNSDQFLYFERRGDGRLERHFGTDNPFNAVGKAAHSEVFGKMGKAQPRARSTLGDWDGDGEADLIVVDESKVTLWINRLTQTFVEVAGKENPFGQLGFSDPTTISLVNVSESGILDIVAPRLHGPLSSRNGSFVYFRHHLSGDLVEQHGAENPFQGLDFPDYYKEMISMDRTFVVDFDADGDLDIRSRWMGHRPVTDSWCPWSLPTDGMMRAASKTSALRIRHIPFVESRVADIPTGPLRIGIMMVTSISYKHFCHLDQSRSSNSKCRWSLRWNGMEPTKLLSMPGWRMPWRSKCGSFGRTELGLMDQTSLSQSSRGLQTLSVISMDWESTLLLRLWSI